MTLRGAVLADAEAVAALHADSWRRFYRGAYSDSFLDGDVATDRLTVWSARLRAPSTNATTIVADDGGELVGFAHVILREDPRWGALLDNLHVRHDRTRQGIGTALMGEVARAAAGPFYLWVQVQNTRAQAFYVALGGRCVERAPITPPGGDPSRLSGSPMKLRFCWN